MPSKAAGMSLLFHPKKNAKNSNNSRSPSPAKPRDPTRPKIPRPQPTPEDDEESLSLPEGSFQDYRLMSSALSGWKYDVMKFDSRKPVDVMTWRQPIKLNRKDLRREPAGTTQSGPLRPMLGQDGNPVFGPNGKPVMIDMDGKIVLEEAENDKGKASGGPSTRKKFQKKTRQVFLVPDEVRKLRKEERYPWIIEDASGKEVWVAQLEDTSKAETYGFFMPAENDIFKFVPSHRWYKFQKKLRHDLPTDTQSVEDAFSMTQKRDTQAWLAQRTGRTPSAATQAVFKAEAQGDHVNGAGSLVHTAGQSLGPGGRKLRIVDKGSGDLFGDDEEDTKESQKRRDKEFGEEGDLDEMAYEEEFADDDEKMELENNDEETKELEERIKREYLSKPEEESDEEGKKPKLSKQERAMRKLIRTREGNDAYDSEDEDNPYASSADEEEEEPVVPPPAPAVPPSEPETAASTNDPSKPLSPRPQSIKSGSRATSPEAAAGMGGHSLVAKRATSPKQKMPNKSPTVSRASSPTLGGRAVSPVANGSRAGSPVAQAPNGIQKKRKAPDESASNAPTPGGPPKAKKRKGQGGPASGDVGELEDGMLIEWLKNTPNATTRDCIQYFTPYLTDDSKKAKFTAMVKEVAQLKNGVLLLRNSYRGGSTAPA